MYSDRKGESFYGRESVYRATVYDKVNAKAMKKDKVDLVIRDLYVSSLTGRGLFPVTSDFETLEGFSIFTKMLQADEKSHEAMFGLGQLNFRIQRYETAEFWFVKAYTRKKDIAYRFWLAMTYFKLFDISSKSNKRRARFAGYAAKNF